MTCAGTPSSSRPFVRKDTWPPELSSLSLRDALPSWAGPPHSWGGGAKRRRGCLAQLWHRLGDLLRQGHGLVPADVDDLLCDPKLEQAAREVDQLAAVLSVPVELDRAPHLSLIPSHRCARLF